jgi:hypothetical protein
MDENGNKKEKHSIRYLPATVVISKNMGIADISVVS